MKRDKLKLKIYSFLKLSNCSLLIGVSFVNQEIIEEQESLIKVGVNPVEVPEEH